MLYGMLMLTLKKKLANNLCLPLFQLSSRNKMSLSKLRFKTSAALMPWAWQALMRVQSLRTHRALC